MAKYRVKKVPKGQFVPQNDVLGEMVKKTGGKIYDENLLSTISNPSYMKKGGHQMLPFQQPVKGRMYSPKGDQSLPEESVMAAGGHTVNVDGVPFRDINTFAYNFKQGGIHIKKENRGKFTAYKKRTGKTTEEALHSSDPHVRKMANFAKNAAKWHHEDGGEIYGLDEVKKGGTHWIHTNPAHKGDCTPLSNPKCTGHKRAFALTMKKHHGFHEEGGGTPEMDFVDQTYKYKKGGPSPDLNPTTNHSIADYNPYIYFKNKNWYITENPGDERITESMKPIEREAANIEAEKGEYLVKPQLMGLYRVGGKKHSEGGTPLFAEGGSFIFSNDPKLAISKKEKGAFGFKEGGSNAMSKNTPAKVLGREISPQAYNGYISTLKNEGNDTIGQTTAALMLSKLQQKLGQIAYLQENKKGTKPPDFSQGTAPVNQPQFASIDERLSEYKYGGMPMYPNGGAPIVPPIDNSFSSYNPDDPYSTSPPDKTGKWAGDYSRTKNPQTGQYSNQWNAMTSFGSPQEYASQVGYPGQMTGNPNDIKAMQTWIGQKYPDLVAKFHGSPAQGGYGQPAAGTPYDGKLGVRWDAIANAIQPHPATPNGIAPIPTTPTGDISRLLPQQPTAPQGPTGGPEPMGTNPTMPYDINGKLNDMQKAHLAYLGLQAFNINRYYPKREQVQLPQVRFDQISAQPQLNQINNQSYAANQLAALNPRTSSLVSSNIRGSAIDQSNQVLGNVANQNVQIGNQQNQFNTQQATQQVMANSQFDNQYYNQVQATNQNFDNERRFANNQFMSTLNQYKSQADALAWQLASVNKYGMRQATDPKTGRTYNIPVPLYQYTGNGIKYNADVANINMANNANRINTPDEINRMYSQFKQSGMDDRTIRSIIGNIVRSHTPKGGEGQGPFFTQNPYGAFQ